MSNRLSIIKVVNQAEIVNSVYLELKKISGKDASVSPATQNPLMNCCAAAANAGTQAILIQRRVQDPDFLAEYAAYYSRQFANIERFCTRVHFFKNLPDHEEQYLDYLDRVSSSDYLGFVTLRPVIKSPVGATIISSEVAVGFVRSDDDFPVNIAGKSYSVKGTPFMQQDNAVGACAQASIWMALRTLRKREGDRAHDPAQITDAATRYFVTGRTRPNRQGLTQEQMTEEMRAAGYSPHIIPLGDQWYRKGQQAMTDGQIDKAMQSIHPYVESQIPVILILYPPTGGHAIVAIGHTWEKVPPVQKTIPIALLDGTVISPIHAVTWTPSFIVHNDNTGPYRTLKDRDAIDYSLQHGASAIPLLPTDVFMSGEEAFALATVLLADVFSGFIGAKTALEIQNLASSLVIRLSLTDKRKLRRWATTNEMSPEVKFELRTMDLPKRLWVFELHAAHDYGNHVDGPKKTLMGFIIMDATGDDLASSYMLMHLNMPALLEGVGIGFGALVKWEPETGIPAAGIRTNEVGKGVPIL